MARKVVGVALASAILIVAAVVMVVAPPKAEAAVSCGTVTSTLAPCFEYILYGGQVAQNCCTGVRSLYQQANNSPARRAVCTCLKAVTGSASPTMVNNAKTLPQKCGVSIPYQITPTIDCAKVK